jgi:hypothetical protein
MSAAIESPELTEKELRRSQWLLHVAIENLRSLGDATQVNVAPFEAKLDQINQRLLSLFPIGAAFLSPDRKQCDPPHPQYDGPAYRIFGLPAEAGSPASNLASLIEQWERGSGSCFSPEKLDLLLAEDISKEQLEPFYETIFDGTWQRNFLSLVDDWQEFARSVLWEKYGLKDSPAADVVSWQKKIVAQMADVLAVYPEMMAENNEFSETWGAWEKPRTIELLRRYRQFTLSAIAMAEDIWPELNWERLKKIG